METNNHDNNTIQHNVLEKIRMNELTMRPRFYHTLKIAALIVVGVVALVTSVFLFSFILFSIRISGQAYLLGYGSAGILRFLRLFPWALLAVNVFSIFVMEWMLRQFRFGYKKSVVYLFLGMIAIVFSVGFFIDRDTNIHRGLLHAADQHNLPLFNGFYEQVRRAPPHREGVCRCVVTDVAGNTLTVIDDDPRGSTTTLKIVLPPGQATTSLKIGDHIFVVGDPDDGIIHAFGIRQAPLMP